MGGSNISRSKDLANNVSAMTGMIIRKIYGYDTEISVAFNGIWEIRMILLL